MTDRFIVTRKEDDVLLGHFDGEDQSGAYLSAEYLNRLGEIRRAVGIRLESRSTQDLPDSLKNLLGVIDRLLNMHEARASAEFNSEERKAERVKLDSDLKSLKKQLDDLGPNEPKQ